MRNLHLLLSTVHTDRSKVEIFQNSVAFSEYMNFNKCIFWLESFVKHLNFYLEMKTIAFSLFLDTFANQVECVSIDPWEIIPKLSLNSAL